MALTEAAAQGEASKVAWMLYAAALGMLAFSLYNGARTGLGRKLMQLVGLLLACAAAWMLNNLGGHLLAVFLPLPLLPLRVVSGAACFSFIYFLFAVASLVVFKKPKDLAPSKWRGISRAGGMLISSLSMLSLLVLMASGLRIATRVADFSVSTELIHEPGPFDPEVPPKQSGFIKVLSGIDDALAPLPGNDLLVGLDPVPEGFYRSSSKLTLVLNTPAAREAWLRQPATRLIINDWEFQAVANDPEVRALAQEGDLVGLMRHPKVAVLEFDPTLREKWQRYDLEGALDLALLEAGIVFEEEG